LDHEEELLIALDAECKENRMFDRLYRDFEMQKVCYLPINSFLLKPPQRLLHYQMILNSKNIAVLNMTS
jgi:FERM, RhoGEF and pleckstrin domain protein 2